MSQPDDLITAKAAARLLMCDVHTIYRYIKSEKLKGYRRAGSRWYVSRSAALSLMKESA
jgi:excisionase family DNA binding protein